MTEVFPFAHLHVHSDYTLARGASKVKDLIKRAVKLEMPALALIDDNVMFGAAQFSEYAAEAGLQPIIGVKMWINLDKKQRGSFILLAQNEAGYRTICTMLSMTHRPHESDGTTVSGSTATVPLDQFDQDMSGVVMLTGGMDGFLRRLVADGRKNEAEELLSWFRSLFCDRIYVEISRFGDETKQEVEIEQLLIDMAYNAPALTGTDGVERRGVPLIATTEVWYAERERHEAYEIMQAVEAGNQITVSAEGVIGKTQRRFHMRSTDEMRELFADIPEAFQNACFLPKRIHFLVKGRKPILPPFPTAGGRTEAEELRAQAWEGLEQRLALFGIEGEARKVYDDRLEFELGIIEKMEFPGYFLIVSDFIKWSKAQDIPVGPGRGSGAGSLVAYALQITNLDPLPFGLLFERFLNPERVSMPDFDIDFCQDRRDEVIQYVFAKYGVDLVSLIVTFGEIKSRGAISDMGRVMISEEHGGYGFAELKRITKLVSIGEGQQPLSLADSYKDKTNPMFKELIDSEPKYGILLDNALKVEGLYRNQGSHAAGVVIGGQPLHTLVPLAWDDKKNLSVSQYNMKYAEKAGLVKFDFLGLKTLSVIKETLLHIKNTTGEEINLDLVPLDDEGTYRMLSEGMSNGVFQLESEGMKRVLADIKPTRIEDLIAVVSLYRPGPMDMIPKYAACKNGKEEPEYPEPIAQTKLFLEETFGIMVYQEQVMLVAQVVAGYSLGGADLLRRAMGKKIAAEMQKERIKFIAGAVENGHDKDKSGDLFDLIAKFAGYGFNKSHAAAYALISYHTAWLKHNYPAQFFSAFLTYETKPKGMAKIKEDMDIMGVPMLPPCINSSWPRFKPEVNDKGQMSVRFGFGAINGISGAMTEFLAERAKGPFGTIEEFWSRVGGNFDKGQLEALTAVGSFDVLSKNRNAAWNMLSWLAKGGKKAFAASAQVDLFGGKLELQIPHDVRNVPEWGNKVDRQFAQVGFYFADHPLDAYLGKLMKVQVKRKASLKQFMLDNKIESLKNKRLAGMPDEVERRQSKSSGKYYVHAKFAEKSDTFRVMFFADPDKVEEILMKLESARVGKRPIVVLGDLVVDVEKDDLTIWGREVYDADTLIADHRGNMQIVINRDEVYPNPEEKRIERNAIESFRQGKCEQKDVDEAALKTKTLAIRRKAGEIRTLLEKMRDDANKHAIPITIKLVIDGEHRIIALDGRYLVDMAAENAIKAMDGVTSVQEEMETSQQPKA